MLRKIGFDNEKYLKEQTAAILERVDKFNNKLYLEFGGKLLFDYHAARVLPGFDPNVKMRLLQRLKECRATEVILATNPTMNGNATAVYISEQLNLLGVKITRIAQGIPPGGDIGYAGQVTLKNALDGRREMR